MMEDLPVGFRFYPSEEELLCYYLPRKLMNATKPDFDRVIPLLHIYDYNPWDLPQFAGALCHEDTEQWFFFTPMQEREARGGRPNRLTQTGYWKATGSPGDVYTSQHRRIGRKKTMVFYEGRAPKGTKTCWKMNEYKLYEDTHAHQSTGNLQLKEELSLCRIYKRSKCARAFDRWPLAAASTRDEAAVPVQYSHHHQSTDEAVITVDNQQIQGVQTEFNWEVATETEPLLWNSELLQLLNWFEI